jgi:hypothetical protein
LSETDDNYRFFSAPFSYANFESETFKPATTFRRRPIERNKLGATQLKLPEDPTSCLIKLGNVKVRGLIDTGSDITILSEKIFKQISPRKNMRKYSLNIQAVSGDSLKVLGISTLSFTIGKQKLVHDFVIIKDIHRNCIIGRDFLNRFSARIYFDLKRIRINNEMIPIESDIHIASLVRTCQSITIQPYTTLVTQGKIKNHNSTLEGVHSLTPITDCIDDEPGLQLMDTILTVSNSNKIPICVVNNTGRTVRLRKDYVIGKLDKSVKINTVTSSNDKQFKENDEQFKFNCNPKYTHLIQPILKKNTDLFAQTDKDLTPTSAIKATIDTGDHKPIKLRPYPTPIKHREIIGNTIKEMLEAKIIEPSNSPWSFPVVLVKKSDGCLRFCVDFRQLNKIIKDDAWPLPRIDEILPL